MKKKLEHRYKCIESFTGIAHVRDCNFFRASESQSGWRGESGGLSGKGFPMRERKCWWMVGRKRKKERTGFFPACQSARKDQRKVAEVRTLRCGERGIRKMKLGEIWTAKEKRIQQGCKCAVHESFACLPGSGGSCVFFRGRESWRGGGVLGRKE